MKNKQFNPPENEQICNSIRQDYEAVTEEILQSGQQVEELERRVLSVQNQLVALRIQLSEATSEEKRARLLSEIEDAKRYIEDSRQEIERLKSNILFAKQQLRNLEQNFTAEGCRASTERSI